MTKPALIVIVGPTAVGKTEISLQLAERLRGEIISADSRLLYRGMDIGTAKPTKEARARVYHHLIDVANPDETWSLVRFQEAARKAIQDVHQRGKLPFLVGGTGQYIRAVIQDWAPPPQPPNPQLRITLEKLAMLRGSSWLHQKLMHLDPLAAESIDARNVRRMVRALEVILGTGRKFSSQRGKGESPYHLQIIGLYLPRPELYARIDARISAMFAAGFLDEVAKLLKHGYSADLPSMSAIGYRQGIDILAGKISHEEGITEMKRLTRIFVRRQANWFRQDNPNINWFETSSNVVDEIEAFIAQEFGEIKKTD